jgi:hypothetical protein
MEMLLPQRDAEPAREIVKSFSDANVREKAIQDAFLSGNVPGWMRNFVSITLNGNGHELVVHVLPDYVTIGNDEDHLLIPMRPGTAQAIADATDCMLPTTKLVSLIWEHATKLQPRPWGPPFDKSMQTTQRYVAHDAIVSANMEAIGVVRGTLVAGHKKDVVITNRLLTNPGKVAIFGWHQLNGKPIQPLSLVHSAVYVDYAHGIRLLSKACTLDGDDDALVRILQDPALCSIVSNEGPLRATTRPYVRS